jgi:diacylglycerol kinase family enzyme
VQIDGEYAGRLPARVEVAHDAITVLAPADYFKS